jgi:hypothetical protein
MKHRLDDGLPVFGLSGDIVDEQERYMFWVNIEEHLKTKYVSDRVLEYPSIGDQLDALWKGGAAAAEMLEKVQAVKAKYPKPEGNV